MFAPCCCDVLARARGVHARIVQIYETQRALYPLGVASVPRCCVRMLLSGVAEAVGVRPIRRGHVFIFFYNDPAARGTGKTTSFISHGKMSTGVFQISAPERHHPTKTLKTVQFGVSNVSRGLLGPHISQVEGWPSWPSGLPCEAQVKPLKGGWPPTQRAHASAAPVTKPDHDLHGGPAGCVHIFINTKVTVLCAYSSAHS